MTDLPKTPRLTVLENSLAKKKAVFASKLDAYIADVRRANGQPMNDKRNGRPTLSRWDRQNEALNKQKEEITKTEEAIEWERSKIAYCESTMGEMPQPIRDLVDKGTLKQWRKHPSIFFVEGVDKARIQWKGGKLIHKFTRSITDKAQFETFKSVYNGLHAQLKE